MNWKPTNNNITQRKVSPNRVIFNNIPDQESKENQELTLKQWELEININIEQEVVTPRIVEIRN